jgi:hypothetical protein
MSDKPLLFESEDLLGEDVIEELSLYGSPDPSYIPGYSEIIRARDIAKGETYINAKGQRIGLTETEKEVEYRKIGAGPVETPYEFTWQAVSGPGNEPNPHVGRARMFAEMEGWKLITVKSKQDFIEKFGENIANFGWPPAADLDADGTIRRGDVALAFVDNRRAKAIERAKNLERERRLGEHTEPDEQHNVTREQTGVERKEGLSFRA